MKELSIEEKAKAYDEAIARAKEMIKAITNIGGVAKVDDIQYLFPELKESEVEKIRKDIKRAISVALDYSYFDKETANNCLAWLEKQGEQKPIDKVEPKFKVGDWIVRGKTIAQILDIQEQYYVGLDINGNDFTSSRFLSDDKIHLWTIQDAKDGDVLALNDKTIVIFKDLYSSTTFHAYCYVKESTFSVSQDDIPDWWNSEGFYPATKEQSDNLMKAMTDAGYTFDFDKKELKKIEQKPWSEEDEKILNTIINDIQERHPEAMWKINAGSTVVVSTQYIIDWLKSIKGRVQPQVEWGEWGKKYIASTIKMVEHCSFSSIGGITKAAAITWLKSLGPQTVWKPSEEQMEALKKAIDGVIGDVLNWHSKDKSLLDSLYNDLKKLKS